MSRLLVLGVGPLPFENRKKVYGSSLRTWHFIKPLLDQGHEIRLVAMQLPDPYHEENLPQILESEKENLHYFSVNELYVFMDPDYLQMHHDEFRPDALIGINTHAAAQACKLHTDKPIWTDLNGWVMAEAQTKTFIYQDDKYLNYFWGQEEPILQKADNFSVVSLTQKYALIGELATSGRLNQHTFGYEFIAHTPNSISPEEPKIGKKILRGLQVAEDAFLVLWSGGYNTWTDCPTLFDGLIKAMQMNPKIIFVSTGGKIDGHDDVTYPNFLKTIERSEFKNCFKILGWIPTEEIPSLYAECDLGLNIDGYNYEVIFGARNRLNGMMRIGLPVLTTIGSEVTEVIAENQIGLTFDRGNSQSLADKILWASAHREELKQLGNAGKKFIYENWTYEKTTRDLQEWAKNPTHAPDWKKSRPALNPKYRLIVPNPKSGGDTNSSEGSSL